MKQEEDLSAELKNNGRLSSYFKIIQMCASHHTTLENLNDIEVITNDVDKNARELTALSNVMLLPEDHK